MKKLILITVLCLFTFQCEQGWLKDILFPVIEGCTDSTACNYNSDATDDDGSCTHADTNHDCSGACIVELDCSGSCGGTAVVDCAGNCGGNAVEDNCGVCDSNVENDCTEDCFGVEGGTAQLDECDVCGGDNSTCTDCNGDVNGTAELDGCNICVDGNTGLSACPRDCAGVDSGAANYNNCGTCICNGSTPPEGYSCVESEECLQGCDGIWKNDGTHLVLDECTVCGGDNLTCTDCNDVINGGAVLDECDVCGGDGSSCTPPNEISWLANASSGSDVFLDWSYDVDSDFSRYEIIRNDEVIITITNSETHSYTDTPIQGNNYTYKVRVYDTGGLYSETGEYHILASDFYPPEPNISISYSGGSVTVSSDCYNISDLQKLNILRKNSINSEAEIIHTITISDVIACNPWVYSDNTISTPDTRYWYETELFDTAGLSTKTSTPAYISFYDDIIYRARENSWNDVDVWKSEIDGYNPEVILTQSQLGTILNIHISPNGKYLLVKTQPNNFYLYDLETATYQLIISQGNNEYTFDVVWDNEDAFYFKNSESGGTPYIYMYNINSQSIESISLTWDSSFDLCKLDNSLYHFSQDGSGYSSINRYYNGSTTELFQFADITYASNIGGAKLTADCNKLIFWNKGGVFEPGLNYYDVQLNEVFELSSSPYDVSSGYEILTIHSKSQFLSDDKLFVRVHQDGDPPRFYGILDTDGSGLTDTGIHYNNEDLMYFGDISVLNDYSKMALQVTQTEINIYSNLPTLTLDYTITKDYLYTPLLIKNKWLD